MSKSVPGGGEGRAKGQRYKKTGNIPEREKSLVWMEGMGPRWSEPQNVGPHRLLQGVEII